MGMTKSCFKSVYEIERLTLCILDNPNIKKTNVKNNLFSVSSLTLKETASGTIQWQNLNFKISTVMKAPLCTKSCMK